MFFGICLFGISRFAPLCGSLRPLRLNLPHPHSRLATHDLQLFTMLVFWHINGTFCPRKPASNLDSYFFKIFLPPRCPTPPRCRTTNKSIPTSFVFAGKFFDKLLTAVTCIFNCQKFSGFSTGFNILRHLFLFFWFVWFIFFRVPIHKCAFYEFT